MTEKQLDTIIGLIAGLQTAVVHLSNTLVAHTDLSRAAIAQSFVATAENVPEQARNRALIQLTLRQIASGIESSNMGDEADLQLRRLLH